MWIQIKNNYYNKIMSIIHTEFIIYDVFNNQSVNKYIKCLKYN